MSTSGDAAAEWQCAQCTLLNSAALAVCDACAMPRDAPPPRSSAAASNGDGDEESDEEDDAEAIKEELLSLERELGVPTARDWAHFRESWRFRVAQCARAADLARMAEYFEAHALPPAALGVGWAAAGRARWREKLGRATDAPALRRLLPTLLASEGGARAAHDAELGAQQRAASARATSGVHFSLTGRGVCLKCQADRAAEVDRWRRAQAVREAEDGALELTPLGFHLASLPVDARLGKTWPGGVRTVGARLAIPCCEAFVVLATASRRQGTRREPGTRRLPLVSGST